MNEWMITYQYYNTDTGVTSRNYTTVITVHPVDWMLQRLWECEDMVKSGWKDCMLIHSTRKTLEQTPVIKIINSDNGWDNVLCLATCMESAAIAMECESVEELETRADENDWIIVTDTLHSLGD